MQQIVTIITTISGVLSSFLVIFFFGYNFAKQKKNARQFKEEEELEHFRLLYGKCAPDLESLKYEFNQSMFNLKQEMTASIQAYQNEVKTMHEKQEARLDDLSEITKITLSSEIDRIYKKYQKFHAIYRYDYNTAKRLYEAYTKRGGNGFIHNEWDEMSTWKIVEKSEVLMESK